MRSMKWIFLFGLTLYPFCHRYLLFWPDIYKLSLSHHIALQFNLLLPPYPGSIISLLSMAARIFDLQTPVDMASGNNSLTPKIDFFIELKYVDCLPR